MTVLVTFKYEPDENDPDHEMGITSDEYDRMTAQLMDAFGAEDITFEKVGA